jgi:hypothetical protein
MNQRFPLLIIAALGVVSGSSAYALQPSPTVLNPNFAYEAGECKLVEGAALTSANGSMKFAYILKNVGAFSMKPTDVQFFDPNGLTGSKTIRDILIDERNEPGVVMKADASPENDLVMITSQGQKPGSSNKTLVLLSMAEGKPSSVKFSGICDIEYVNELDQKVAQFQMLGRPAQ